VYVVIRLSICKRIQHDQLITLDYNDNQSTVASHIVRLNVCDPTVEYT